MRLIADFPRQNVTATIAQVTYSGEGGFGAAGHSEKRGIPIFGPRGLFYRPVEGDTVLLLNVDGADLCVGVLCAQGQLSGGGAILLQQNGDIHLNEVVVTKQGGLLLPRGAEIAFRPE